MKRNILKKIVWAANPFDENPTMQASMLSLFRNLRMGRGFTVEPVYVGTAENKRYATDKLRSRFSSRLPATILKPRVIESDSNSIRSAVDSLLKYCRANKISAIAVATHARKGFPRLMLGSFAESLLLSSPIPLIFVNPHQKPPRSIKKILYPCDLTKGARKGFMKAVGLAQELEASVEIFSSLNIAHRAILQTEDIGGFAFPAWMDAGAAEKSAKSLVQAAKKLGIKAEFVHRASVDSVVDSILRELRRSRADILAISTQPIPKIPILTGSHTRQLVRRSPLPIIAFRA
jgi:nucleotide-binding universal stress UspA family protein